MEFRWVEYYKFKIMLTKKNKVGRPKVEPTKILNFRISKVKADKFLSVQNSKIRKRLFEIWADEIIKDCENATKPKN